MEKKNTDWSISDPGVKNINGSGWVKVDLTKTKIISTNTLPVDPLNSNDFYYRYCSDGVDWEIDVPIESGKYKSKAAEDNGDDPNFYEVGSSLTLCK